MPYDSDQIDGGPCRRGRPREFDADAALDAALAVFWRHGFEGTSLSDLTDAMGINRPSLYAAFGNKEDLFRRAMDRYDARVTAALTAALSEPTGRGAVERLLRESADAMTSGCTPAGCFMVTAAMTCGPASAALQADVAARRREASGPLLQARFARSVDAGELPPGTDVAQLASFFKTVLNGLGVQAASGADRATLHGVIDVALRAWPAPPAPPDADARPPRRA